MTITAFLDDSDCIAHNFARWMEGSRVGYILSPLVRDDPSRRTPPRVLPPLCRLERLSNRSTSPMDHLGPRPTCGLGPPRLVSPPAATTMSTHQLIPLEIWMSPWGRTLFLADSAVARRPAIDCCPAWNFPHPHGPAGIASGIPSSIPSHHHESMLTCSTKHTFYVVAVRGH